MNPNNVWKKNRDFYIGVAGTVLEGVLSGSLFMLLYSVMRFLWDGQFDMNRVLALTGIIAVICIFHRSIVRRLRRRRDNFLRQ